MNFSRVSSCSAYFDVKFLNLYYFELKYLDIIENKLWVMILSKI